MFSFITSHSLEPARQLNVTKEVPLITFGLLKIFFFFFSSRISFHCRIFKNLLWVSAVSVCCGSCSRYLWGPVYTQSSTLSTGVKCRQMRFSWPQHSQGSLLLLVLRPTAHKDRRVSIVFFVISNLPALGLAPSLISCGDISNQLPYRPHVPKLEGKLQKAEHLIKMRPEPWCGEVWCRMFVIFSLIGTDWAAATGCDVKNMM